MKNQHRHLLNYDKTFDYNFLFFSIKFYIAYNLRFKHEKKLMSHHFGTNWR